MNTKTVMERHFTDQDRLSRQRCENATSWY